MSFTYIYIHFFKATMLIHILGSLCDIYILQIVTSSVTVSFKFNKKYKICDHFKSLFPVFYLLNLKEQQQVLNTVYMFHTEDKIVSHLIICKPVAGVLF